MNIFRYFKTAFKGPLHARRSHALALEGNPGIMSGLAELQGLCPINELDDEPIFLLSAGWRSGSTLLQRLVMSDSRVFIWGEPYDECGMIQTLAESVKAFRSGWPPEEYFYDGRASTQLTGEWIANLFPSLADWKKCTAFFIRCNVLRASKNGRVPSAGASKRFGSPRNTVRIFAGFTPGQSSSFSIEIRWMHIVPTAVMVAVGITRFPDTPIFTPTQFGNHGTD